MQVFDRNAIPRLTRTLLLVVCGFLTCATVCGLDRNRSIHQFYHTAWTAKDGAPSQINSLAQTQDGYLWIGSDRGLFRFDGVQFEPYKAPPGVTLPSHNINTLMATPDGGLWMSFNPTGLAFQKSGSLTVFDLPENMPPSEVVSFARDFDGRIWAGARTGLLLFDGSRWINPASHYKFHQQRVFAMFVDREGTLWVAGDDTVVFLRRGTETFQPTGMRVDRGIVQIGAAMDGRVWATEWSQVIRPIQMNGGDQIARAPTIGVRGYRFLFDREGSLWLTSGDSQGVQRVRFPERLGERLLRTGDPELETFTAENGLTDNSVSNLFEDREGNIWIASNKGLDRFRHSHLVPVFLPAGYRDFTLVAGNDGEIWIGSAAFKPLVRFRGEQLTPTSNPMKVSSVFQEPSGVTWWGGSGGVWRQHRDRFDYYPQPKSIGLDWIWEIIPDGSDGFWVGVGDVGLMHFRLGTWAGRERPQGVIERVPSASFLDTSGRIWLGYTENRVTQIDGQRVQAFTHNDGIDIGRIRVIRGRDPYFWFGGELGLAIFKNGSFKTVRTASKQPFGTVSGIVETPEGALWLNELHGIVRISPEEVRRVAENPDHAVSFELFDFLDGLPGAPQMPLRSSTAIRATDGKLWFATDNGLAWIDPSNISLNMVRPPVLIRSFEADEKHYDPSKSFELPARTSDLKIEYTALSLSIPERVRFRYKLEGADHEWQDAGTRRQAFYNNLGPGTYSFRVVASNNDGIWNEEGAILTFSVAPAWYQTTWFLIACVFLGLLSLWVIYNFRMRKVAQAINARFDERLAERTRLAQDLHDTLLQTIQASKMVADDAMEATSDPNRMRRAIEQLSVWLGQATLEGRATLNSLRSSISETNDLAEAFRRATQNALIPSSMAVTFSVLGDPRELHPIVRDEIYHIGDEAIRNAYTHSEASRLDVELTYAQDLSLRVSDNGIGIAPEISEAGKDGHFGLHGMRERAARIGAKFTLISSTNLGATVTLVVPGTVVFKRAKKTRFQSFGSLFARLLRSFRN